MDNVPISIEMFLVTNINTNVLNTTLKVRFINSLYQVAWNVVPLVNNPILPIVDINSSIIENIHPISLTIPRSNFNQFNPSDEIRLLLRISACSVFESAIINSNE